jgi:hypothetical protein
MKPRKYHCIKSFWYIAFLECQNEFRECELLDHLNWT